QGEIVVGPLPLYLLGPADRTFTINGAGNGSVFNVLGADGVFEISYLTITGGLASTVSGNSYGGCIFAATASINLKASTLTGCEAYAGAEIGKPLSAGGAVWAHAVFLFHSRVVDSRAIAYSGDARGGGVFGEAGLSVTYSTISGNLAGSYGGGI